MLSSEGPRSRDPGPFLQLAVSPARTRAVLTKIPVMRRWIYGLEIPRFVPICSVPMNGNAMTATDTSKLDKLRPAPLELQKALLAAQRIRYEPEHGSL